MSFARLGMITAVAVVLQAASAFAVAQSLDYEYFKARVDGDPGKSLLLLQPLAPEAGGNAFHSGGRQFASRNDPEWKILAQWVNGAKQAARPGK